MSVLGKLPFVQKIMGAMSGEQLVRLNQLVNNLGEPEFVEFDKIGEANKGVNYVRLTFSELYMNSHFGFLIYIDNAHCGFFSFQDFFEEMKSIEIDPVNHKYWYLQEHLSVEEFRRALDDAMETVVPEPTLLDAAKIYQGDFIGDETAFSKEMKVGDIIVNEEGGIWLIKEIAWDGDDLDKVVLQGFEDNNVPTTYTYDGSNWSHTELSVDTSNCAKVYRSEYGYDELPSLAREIMFNAEEGDILVLDDVVYVVIFKSSDYFQAMSQASDEGIIFGFAYTNWNTEVDFSLEEYEYNLNSMKLYKHHVLCGGNDEYEFEFIDADATPLSSSNTWEQVCERLMASVKFKSWYNNNALGITLYNPWIEELSDGFYSIFGMAHNSNDSSEPSLYGGSNDFETVTGSNTIGSTSDVVTPL